MDVKATTPRLSAYFAFGVQWAPPTQNTSAGGGTDTSTRVAASGGSADNTLSSAGASVNGRVIDIQARRLSSDARQVNPDSTARKNPVRRQGNIFLAQAPVTTYAPPASTGQPVRLIQSAATPGENLDAWA